MKKTNSTHKRQESPRIGIHKTESYFEIKDLPQKFIGRGEVKGHLFTQLSKTDRAFLYEVNTGDGIYYEVFKRKVNWRYGCISYPTSKAFGIYAWFYSDLDKAKKKYDELNS